MANILRGLLAARRANIALSKEFGRIGTKKHPRGFVLTNYRTARRALKQGLDEDKSTQENVAIIHDVGNTLKSAITFDTTQMLKRVAKIGAANAEAQRVAMELPPIPAELQPNTLTEQAAIVASIVASIDAQLALAVALTVAKSDLNAVLGDNSRVGVVAPAGLASKLAVLTATLLLSEYIGTLLNTPEEEKVVQRIAVAVIDSSTTNTCQLVDGQVVDVDEKFTLTGTPRFAGKMASPPFHWWCRTTEAIYRKDAKEGPSFLKKALLKFNEIDDTIAVAALIAGGAGEVEVPTLTPSITTFNIFSPTNLNS